MPIAYIYPNAVASTDGTWALGSLSQNGSSRLWDAVNDPFNAVDNQVSYIASSGQGAPPQITFGNTFPGNIGTINSLTIVATAGLQMNANAGAFSMTAVLSFAGQGMSKQFPASNSATFNLSLANQSVNATGGWTQGSLIATINPITGVAWTSRDVSAISGTLGPLFSSTAPPPATGGRALCLTSIYIKMDYSFAAPDPALLRL